MSAEPKFIRWTVETREQLRKSYKLAVENKHEVFVFNGDQYVTDYARYLLQHLDNTFGPAK